MLTQFQSDDRVMQMLQNSWASVIDPVISRPQNQSLILENVHLIIGTNTINHKLGRKLQGWKLVRQKALASIYDLQDANPMPELTLKLVSNAVVTVNIEVF